MDVAWFPSSEAVSGGGAGEPRRRRARKVTGPAPPCGRGGSGPGAPGARWAAGGVWGRPGPPGRALQPSTARASPARPLRALPPPAASQGETATALPRAADPSTPAPKLGRLKRSAGPARGRAAGPAHSRPAPVAGPRTRRPARWTTGPFLSQRSHPAPRGPWGLGGSRLPSLDARPEPVRPPPARARRTPPASATAHAPSASKDRHAGGGDGTFLSPKIRVLR